MISPRTQTTSRPRRSPGRLCAIAIVPLLASSCQPWQNVRSRKAALEFEVYWQQEAVKELRARAPVYFDKEQVGSVAATRQRYDAKASETRTFALLRIQQTREPIRLGDRIAYRTDGPDDRPCIWITLKQGDRMKYRLVENGMLIEGATGPTLAEKASGAWDLVKEKSSDLADKTKETYQDFKDKIRKK